MNRLNELRGYFLAHSYPAGLKPFASVMDLPPADANRLVAEFTQKSSGSGNYYEHRHAVETWLRGEAEKADVRITNPHPIYFWLTPAPVNISDAANAVRTVSLPLSVVDLSACSFTIGDSFCHHQFKVTGGEHSFGLPQNPFMGRVLSIGDAAAILGGHRHLADNPHSYVEVQFWNRLPGPR